MSLRTTRTSLLALAAVAGLLAATLLGLAGALAWLDEPPRALSVYIERRTAQHRPWVSRTGAWAARMLIGLDRGTTQASVGLASRMGAQTTRMPLPTVGARRVVTVASPEAALAAFNSALAGDVITLMPGTYRFRASIAITRPGATDAGIFVRAARAGKVFIEVESSEGFVVSAPYWRFENLTIRGTCARQADCEHAFHVVGGGHDFLARNNTLIDFNAQVKVNGQDGRFPDTGRLENNTLVNRTVRRTDNAVTPIDLVAVSRWIIRGNLIADFVKSGGDGISYGAYAKGGGSDNRFERNAVLCEHLLRGFPGQRVGLSIGGGGTGPDYCRDGECIFEQEGGIVDSNLVAGCSDDGIYVNRGARSLIRHNTLIDTAGIVVRFPESGALVEGNLVDGAIRGRDGAALHADDNLTTGVFALYFGRHPQRLLFRDADALDLAWAGDPPRHASSGASSPDLCGATRPSRPVYGAVESITGCGLAGLSGR